MTFEFSDKEISTLVELSYLGNWLSNSASLPDAIIKKYDNFLKELVKKISAETKQEIYYDELYDILEPVINHYNGEILFSELAKQYANYIYPFEPSEIIKSKDKKHKQFVCNSVLERACEEALRIHGLSIVNISLPDIQQKIEEEFQKSLRILNQNH